MSETTIYYQPTIEEFTYSFWEGGWVLKQVHSSTLIFPNWGLSEQHKGTFIQRLRDDGIKIKEGHYHYFNAKLVLNSTP